MPSFTPDGKAVIYTGWATGSTLLYKVPAAGGDTVCLSRTPIINPQVSPNGKHLLCGYFDSGRRKFGPALLAFDGVVLRRILDLPKSFLPGSMHWSPDGKEITYIDQRKGISNIWSMPAEGGEPRQLTNFSSGQIFFYAWSPDGNSLAVARGQETSDVVLMTERQ
jgi:TolB protein